MRTFFLVLFLSGSWDEARWQRQGFELYGPGWLPADDIAGTPCEWNESSYPGFSQLPEIEREWLRLGYKLHRCGVAK